MGTLRQRFVGTYPLEPYQFSSVVRYYDAARVGLELGEPTLRRVVGIRDFGLRCRSRRPALDFATPALHFGSIWYLTTLINHIN